MAKNIKWVCWAFLLISFSSFGATMDKFDWQATESAPENYPMQIVSGNLIYPDGGSLYVPDKSAIDHGWGKGRSSHIVGPDLKPLPAQLMISFFSYTENQFYSDRFELPYEKILKLFQDGYYSPKEEDHITYSQIVVGVAPGGFVSVWLAGIDNTTEVFFAQANKEEGNWGSINENPDFTRDEYVRLELKESLSPENLETLNRNGVPFGLWKTYHDKRYNWRPLFTGLELRDGLISLIGYFNGEKEYQYYPLEIDITETGRAIPSDLHFVWKRPGKKGAVIRLYFDEKEMFEVFEQLGSKKQSLQLEMRMIDTDKGKQFGVLLRNKDDEIFLKHVVFKKYAARS